MTSHTVPAAAPAPLPEGSSPKAGWRGSRGLRWTGGLVLALALVTALVVAIWDWNWVRGPLAGIASARLHRQVTITGNLSVHPFSWQPSATVEGIRIANPQRSVVAYADGSRPVVEEANGSSGDNGQAAEASARPPSPADPARKPD